jgi:hypothetical protein
MVRRALPFDNALSAEVLNESNIIAADRVHAELCEPVRKHFVVDGPHNDSRANLMRCKHE